MKPTVFSGCLVFIFLYFATGGCSDPRELIAPSHYTRVPAVTNLRATINDSSASGPRRITVRWEYDTTNFNLRSWDILRNIDDTTSSVFKELETVKRPETGFPVFVDASAVLTEFTNDSLLVYYRIVPNGSDNFRGPISDILQILVRKRL